MNAKTKALSQEARKLSPDERIALIEDLQRSLVPTDPEIDHAWAEEARDDSARIVVEKSKRLPLRKSSRASQRGDGPLPQSRPS